jgi:hypothetical protein
MYNPSSTIKDTEGLTDEEYQFLLDDIEEAIAEGNRKYGYGEPGYIDTDGNFYPFPDNDKDKPRQTLTLVVKSKSKHKRERRRRIGPSIEQVAVARGIIRAIHQYLVPKEASYQ